MATKKRRFNVKTDDGWVERLHLAAKMLDRPASQLVREAVSEKIEALAQNNPKLKKALAA